MKLYEYLVVYCAPGMLGRCAVTRDTEISCYDDLKGIENDIEKQLIKEGRLYTNATILNYKLIREFEGELEEDLLIKP